MAQVTVNLYLMLDREILKDKVKIEASNVAEALNNLAERYGSSFRKEVYDNGKLKDYYILLHNGKMLKRDALDKVQLKEGDTLHIFPPASGG